MASPRLKTRIAFRFLEVRGCSPTISARIESPEGDSEKKTPADIEIPSELEQRWRVEEDFIAAARSPASIQPQPSFAQGLQYMRVVQGVADSVALGSEMEIALSVELGGKHDS